MTFYHFHTVKTRLKFVEMEKGHWYIFIDYSSVGGPSDVYLFTDDYFFSKREAADYLRDYHGPTCEDYEIGVVFGHLIEIEDGIDNESLYEEEEEE